MTDINHNSMEFSYVYSTGSHNYYVSALMMCSVSIRTGVLARPLFYKINYSYIAKYAIHAF